MAFGLYFGSFVFLISGIFAGYKILPYVDSETHDRKEKDDNRQ